MTRTPTTPETNPAKRRSMTASAFAPGPAPRGAHTLIVLPTYVYLLEGVKTLRISARKIYVELNGQTVAISRAAVPEAFIHDPKRLNELVETCRRVARDNRR